MNNFNLVLRTYTAMRQMTPDDLALLVTLRSLNDTDREKLIETLSDKPQKKAGKKGAGKGASKSARASSLQSQISSALKPLTDVINQPRCAYVSDDSDELTQCDEIMDHNVHHKQTDANYHEFVIVAPAAHAASSGE